MPSILLRSGVATSQWSWLPGTDDDDDRDDDDEGDGETVVCINHMNRLQVSHDDNRLNYCQK